MRGNATVRQFSPLGEDDVGLDNDPMYYLTRIFVYFLQNLYRDFPEGCGMQWNPKPENSELIITAEKPVLEEVEKRPHITCVLGGAQFSGLGLDQLQHQRASDGQRVHTDLVPMSITYHCMAKEGLQARRVAWNSSFYTIILRRIIMRVGGLFQVGVRHQISPESPASQLSGPSVDNRLVEVTVNVPFYWQPQWRIKRASEVWRRMKIQMRVKSVDGIYSAGRSNLLRPPRVKGVPVQTAPIAPPGDAFVQSVHESKFFGEEEE